MSDDEKNLTDLVLAPYIMKAIVLIRKARRVGGNQFRHCFATLGILLDYKYFSNSILLKASVIHDLIEELPTTDINELRIIDREADRVADLVMEVTRLASESKEQYLRRILEKGTTNARILKAADRISNLTDLNNDSTSKDKIASYLSESENYIVPMARQVDNNMVIELTDLINIRRSLICNL